MTRLTVPPRIRIPRFTVAAKQNPAYSKLADAPGGVPISAIVFGGRRRTLAPLVYQARDWVHGVLVGGRRRLGNHGRGDGRRRRGSPRPDGHEALCRLQLRRLLVPLDQRGRQAEDAAADFSCQLVPPGRRGQVPMARFPATTCGCCAGLSIAAAARRRHATRPLGTYRMHRIWTLMDWTSRRPRSRNSSGSTPPSGRPSSGESQTIWTNSAVACRRLWRPNSPPPWARVAAAQ